MWHEGISNAFVPLEVIPLTRQIDSFSGGLKSRKLGDLQLSQVLGQCVRVRRSTDAIRRADPGVVKVALQLRGNSTVCQQGHETRLSPGDIAIYDTSEPYELCYPGTFDTLVTVVSRTSLRVSGAELREAAARRIESSSGVGALLRPILEILNAQPSGTACASITPLVTDAVADLVSAAVRLSAPDARLSFAETILTSAQAYIESHLADVGLSPAAVAAQHHVSTRYLQKLFARNSQTVSGFIRQCRLERCRRDLEDPVHAHRSVGSIATANGLVNAAHFSRLFRSTYGVTPRGHRNTTLSTLSRPG